jgi:hypothetical protein
VTRRRVAVLAAAPVVALLAVAAALLAVDASRTGDALRAGDARYRVAPAAARWDAATILPGDPARRLLATGDDLALRRAVRLFRISYATPGRLDTAVEAQGVRAVAELALADVARSHDVRRAAQASNLLGILAFGDFARGGGRDASQAERSVSAFANAVRLDPADTAAKYNLELALGLFRARGVRPGASPGNGGTGPGHAGAGAGIPGSGY